MFKKARNYKKKSDISYCLGVYPAIELLKYKPEIVDQIFISSRGKTNKGVIQIIEICRKENISWEFADKAILRAGGNEGTYAVGVFRKYESQIENSDRHLLLDKPEDAGNLGTIIRTALGFGIKDIVVIRPGVDVFNPKVVRASMGSVFKQNVEYFNSFSEYLKKYSGRNCYAFMTNGKQEASEMKTEKPFTLIFGNEGAGLGIDYKTIENTLRISQSSEVDSLNLAVSVGIGLYLSGKN